jgi:hypothetical protein
MLKAIFLVLQLRSSCGMHNLYVASIRPLYHFKNDVVLKDVFSESIREC